MTIRPRSHVLEEVSKTKLREALVDGMGWVIEELHKDYGEDLFVRIFKDGRATPLAFFIQAKASSRAAFDKRRKRFSVRVKTAHLHHWAMFWEPVFVTLYDARRGNTYWEAVHYYLETPEGRTRLHSAGKTISIPIPAINRLDEEGIKRMLIWTKQRFRRHANEELAAKVLLELLEDAGVEIIEYSPENECVAKREKDGGATYIYFGQFAELMDARGISGEQIKQTALKHAREPGETVTFRGNHVFVTWPSGNKAKYSKHEWFDIIRLRRESLDLEEEIARAKEEPRAKDKKTKVTLKKRTSRHHRTRTR
jgi:Domain of unknown function (DUF4365)